MRGWTAAKTADASGACGALPNIVAPPGQSSFRTFGKLISYINLLRQQKFIDFSEIRKSV
jgi:hypothetical protein